MDDGSFRLRTLTTVQPTVITCVFSPMTESQSSDFETYLYSVAGTELDITHNGKTYRGYIDGKTVDKAISDGALHWWSFAFKAGAV